MTQTFLGILNHKSSLQCRLCYDQIFLVFISGSETIMCCMTRTNDKMLSMDANKQTNCSLRETE